MIFSGGLAQGNNRKGLTLMRGRSKMLLLSDFVVDFVCMVDTPWQQGGLDFMFPRPFNVFVVECIMDEK